MSNVVEQPTICGKPIEGRKHICAFVDSRDQQYEILLPFLLQGLASNDMILSIVDPSNVVDHYSRCRRKGIDLTQLEAGGKACTFVFENAYLKDGYFSADRMVRMVETTLATARQKGFDSVRGFGEMHWALTGLPGTEELVEYECRVNEVVQHDPLVCIYDVNRFPGRVLMDVLCTHPKVILNGQIVENEFYVPPEQFLAAYRARTHKGHAA